MTDQELKDLVASLAIAQAKTDEQVRKTTEELNDLQKLFGYHLSSHNWPQAYFVEWPLQ